MKGNLVTLEFEEEVSRGKRFEFGKNWGHFLNSLEPDQIVQAERSLKEMLQVEDLKSISFLDVGSGSGLFSLAARRLGATVHSFDYDPASVSCTQELRSRYRPDDADWIIGRGSILDHEYLESLGGFDIVYSWGVLHHSGQMWEAISNTAALVAPGGRCFIAIYNDQGWKSRGWRLIKATHNFLPRGLNDAFSLSIFLLTHTLVLAKYAILLRPWVPFKSWLRSGKERGMNPLVDWKDWVGGYPFEVAKPAELISFFESHNFQTQNSKLTNALGCNQFVFRKQT